MSKHKTERNKAHRLKAFMKSRRVIAITAVSLIGVIALLTLPIFPYTFSVSEKVNYNQTTIDTSSLEMGQSRFEAVGKAGERVTAHNTKRSIWNVIFGGHSNGTDSSNEITKQPIQEVQLIGTRKYQYMLCSDGGYMYYTDEQFINKSVGYTSASADSCKDNGKGSKVSLADSSYGDVTKYNTAAPRSETGCVRENVVKFNTVYQDASYLSKGTTKEGFSGTDGFTLYCPALKGTEYERSEFKVMDRVVYVGSGKTAQEIAQEEADAAEIRRQQQILTEQNQRNRDRNACISSLTAQGMQRPSAESQCLRLYPQ